VPPTEVVFNDLRAARGKLDLQMYPVWKESQIYNKLFEKMSDKDRLDFYQRVQTNQPQPTPELQAAADRYRVLNDFL